jgi:hypothetical protein
MSEQQNDKLLAALACLSGGLANGREQRIGGSTPLHERDRPGDLRPDRVPYCQRALLIVH